SPAWSARSPASIAASRARRVSTVCPKGARTSLCKAVARPASLTTSRRPARSKPAAGGVTSSGGRPVALADTGARLSGPRAAGPGRAQRLDCARERPPGPQRARGGHASPAAGAVSASELAPASDAGVLAGLAPVSDAELPAGLAPVSDVELPAGLA